MTEKYFLDSYIIKDKKNNKYLWIYGYLLRVENDSNPINKVKINSSLKLYRLTGTIELLDDNKIIESLSERINNDLNIDILIPSKLRSNLLVGINYNDYKNKPTNELSDLDEYWNLDKKILLSDIKDIYNNTEEEIISSKIKELLKKFTELTGVNFIVEPQRFGNLEVYKHLEEKANIQYKFTKDNKLIVEFKKTYKNDIYVKAYSENNKRCILNELKILRKGNNSIMFDIPENTFHILIEIWDYSGKIIYFSNQYYMRSLMCKINHSNISYKVEDPWSKKLKKSTRHEIDDIEKVTKVEECFEFKSDPSISSDIFYSTTKLYENIFNEYKNKNISPEKGIFIKSQSDLSGEINSYNAIKELIDLNELDKIIIMDPYFSTDAISKLLTRINNNVEIIVITSLTNINPDNNSEIGNYATDFQNYIKNNISIIHNRLEIINILSGTKQAFHDRYLIRCFKNKDIDGFILSNSLNSMGRSYPFLIHPLNQEITFEITKYIEELIDVDNKGYTKEYKDIKKEIIFSYKTLDKKKNTEEKVLPKILSKKNNYKEAVDYCLKQEFICAYDNKDDRYKLSIDKYEEIITTIIRNWDFDEEETIKGIGEFLYSYNNSSNIIDIYEHIVSVFKDNGVLEEEVICGIKKVTNDLENKVDINSLPLSNYIKQLFLGLNNESKFNYNYIYNYPEYIVEGKYLGFLYKLLWTISKENYIELLKDRKSPFMLSNIIHYINCKSFDLRLYKLLIDSEIDVLLGISNNWISDEYMSGKLKIDEFENEFENYSELCRLQLLVFMLSCFIFKARVEKTKDVKNKINNTISITCNKIIDIVNSNILSREDIISSLDKLSDILLEEKILIARKNLPFIKDHSLIDFIINYLVSKTLNYIDETNSKLYEEDKNYINNIIQILEDFKDEKYLKEQFYNNKFIKTYFELDNNPLLKEINPGRWIKLINILSFKNYILKQMKIKGFDFEDIDKYLIIGNSYLDV